MRFSRSLASFLLLFSASCHSSFKAGSTDDQSIIDAKSNSTNLVGGLEIKGNNFRSTGRFEYWTPGFQHTCTLTRIGPRHFMTAGHCDARTAQDGEILLQGKPWTFGKPYKVSNESIFKPHTSDGPWLEIQPKTGYNRPTNASLTGANKDDWGVLVLNTNAYDVDQYLQNVKFLNDSYPIREIANPRASIRVGNTVMVAGLGQSYDEDGLIARCTQAQPVVCYDQDYDPKTQRDWDNYSHDMNANYAFFQVMARGTPVDEESGFLFASKTDLIEKPGEEWIDYEFDQNIDEGSTNPLGMIAGGDSGGPVLNGSEKLIGVVSSFIDPSQRKFSFFNLFSAFPYKTVNDLILKPDVFIAPKEVVQTESFAIFGQNINRLDFKSEEERVMAVEDSCLSLTPDQVSLIESIKLEKGKDYQCYKAPAVPGLDRTYTLKSKKTGDMIRTIIVRGKNQGCVTEVKWFAKDNGQKYYQEFARSGPSGAAAQGAFSDKETLGETKARSIQDAFTKADAFVAWANTHQVWYYGEDCAGGTKGPLSPADAQEIANSAVPDPFNIGQYTCVGGGVVHEVIDFGIYELGKTTCH